MPNAEFHEKSTFVVLGIALTALFLESSMTNKELLIIAASGTFGALMMNPDLDTASRVRNRWLFLKFIWKPFNHRGILHNPLTWIVPLGIAYIYQKYYNPDVDYVLYIVGITGCALLHLFFDKIMDFFHWLGINI